MILNLAMVAAVAFFGAFAGSFVGTMWALSYRDMKGLSRHETRAEIRG